MGVGVGGSALSFAVVMAIVVKAAASSLMRVTWIALVLSSVWGVDGVAVAVAVGVLFVLCESMAVAMTWRFPLPFRIHVALLCIGSLSAVLFCYLCVRSHSLLLLCVGWLLFAISHSFYYGMEIYLHFIMKSVLWAGMVPLLYCMVCNLSLSPSCGEREV